MPVRQPVSRSNSLPTRAPARARATSSGGGVRGSGKKPGSAGVKRRGVPGVTDRIEDLRPADPSPKGSGAPLPPRYSDAPGSLHEALAPPGESRCLFYVAFQPEPGTLSPPPPLRLQLNVDLPMSRVYERIRRHLRSGVQFSLFWDGAPVNDALTPKDMMMPTAAHSGEFSVLQVLRKEPDTAASDARVEQCEHRAHEAELRLAAFEEEITNASHREARLSADLATRDAEIRELRETVRRSEVEVERLQEEMARLDQEQELEEERSARAAEAERVRWREQVDLLNLDLARERERALDLEQQGDVAQEGMTELKQSMEEERTQAQLKLEAVTQELAVVKEQLRESKVTPEAASMRASLKTLLDKYRSRKDTAVFEPIPRGHTAVNEADYSPPRWDEGSSPDAATSEAPTEIETV